MFMKKSKKVVEIVFALILIVGTSLFILIQKNTSPLSELQYDKDAYKILQKADSFSFSGTGYGGDMSQETEAYAELLKSKDAKKVFIELEEHANMQGKLYSLCAFYFLDNEHYKEQVQKYLSSKEKVEVMSGCIMGEYEVCNIMSDSTGNMGVDFSTDGIPKILNSYIKSDLPT